MQLMLHRTDSCCSFADSIRSNWRIPSNIAAYLDTTLSRVFVRFGNRRHWTRRHHDGRPCASAGRRQRQPGGNHDDPWRNHAMNTFSPLTCVM